MSEALLPVANRLSQTLPKPISNTGPDMHVGGVTWTDNIRGWDTEIIDEAQASYQFTSLWNDLIKLIEPGYGIFIVLLSFFL